MNEQLKILIELQEMDSSILSIADQIETLPGKLDQFKTPLKKAKDSLQSAQAKNEVLNKKKKDKDRQLDEIQDKIDKLKTRNSDIKTNKEYEAHLKEIESFEKNRYKIEDEILSLMEDIENLSSELQKEEVEIKKVEDEFKQQEKVIGEEEKKLLSEIETQKARRNDFAGRIDEKNYNQYMGLLKRLGGNAVVRTENEICLGCNTNIPPQLYNDIKKNEDIYTCYFCKRFLFYKEPVPSEKTVPEIPPQS